MRNLVQYPITLDEIVETLETLKKQVLAEEHIGDIRPLCLDMAIAAVQHRQMKLWERGE